MLVVAKKFGDSPAAPTLRVAWVWMLLLELFDHICTVDVARAAGAGIVRLTVLTAPLDVTSRHVEYLSTLYTTFGG